MDGDGFKISPDELRDLDLTVLLNIDLDGAIRPVLRLEDLESIDWNNVASSVLGIADPIGQLRDWLAGLLTGFVNTVKNFLTPMADLVGRIWSAVSAIPGALSQLMDAFRAVVLDPIRNAIQFALDALGRIRDLFANLTGSVTQAIQSIPGQVSSIIGQVASALQSSIDNIRNALGGVVSAIARIPESVQNVVNSLMSALGGFGNRVNELLNNIANNIARIPQAIGDVLSRTTGLVSDFVGRVQTAFSELLSRLSQIPQAVADVASRIATFVGDLANKMRDVLSDVANRIAQIPGVLADVLNRLGATVGDFANKIQRVLQELANRIMQVPAAVGEAVSRIATFLGDLAGRLQSAFGEIATRMQQGFGVVFDAVRQAGTFISDLLNRARDAVTNFVNNVVQQIQNIPNALSGVVKWLNDAFNSVAGSFRWVLEQIRTLPDTFSQILRQIVGAAESAGGVVLNAFRQVGDWIQKATTLLHQVAGALMGFANTLQRLPEELWRLIPEPIRNAFQAIYDFFTKTLPEWFRGLIDNLSKAVAEFAKDPLRWFQEYVAKPLWNLIPEPIKGAFQAIYDFFTKTLPEWFRGFIEGITNFFKDPLKWIEENVAKPLWGWFQENIVKPLWDLIPEPIRNVFQAIHDFFTKTLPEVGEKVFEEVTKFFEDPGKWIHDRIVKPLWDLIPEPVRNTFEFIRERLKQAFETLGKWWEEFSKDPIKWLSEHLLKPVMDLPSKLADAITSGVKAVMEVVDKVISASVSAVRNFVETLIRTILGVIRPRSPSLFGVVGSMIDAVGQALSSVGEAVAKAFEDQLTGRWVKNAEKVEEVLQQGFERAQGIGNQMWWIGSQLMMPYWQSTVVAFALRGLARTLGHLEMRIEPQVAGTKMLGFDVRVNLGELLSSVAETLPSYAHAFAIGSSFAIAQLYLQNVQMWYAPRVLEYYEKVKDKLIAPIARALGAPNAVYNAFVRIPSENEIIQWAHRWISTIKASQYRDEIREVQTALSGDVVPKDMSSVLDTIKLHLYYFGLPKWYVEFMSQDPDKFYLAFEDRFGALRKIPLSPLYELPTHSELARMTQRDIFPSVKTMQAVTWIRGWNEDISTLMYLLTFKYPSFEKLWEFYTRAIAGMLWFSPPDYARTIFSSEAEQVKAGKPISPLDVQNALASRGSHAMQAFETALNLYLKWLEYSNFSWITPGTKLQGVNVGQIVYSALGGWTADSWLMWDVAADIPTKIDMRWMSRYGIFMYMASRIGEQLFASYTPLVKVVDKLLDSSPESKLTVELQWFSKLLQATGLHPAWVPIVTVAENIMTIADEMTLLRTGWINLFKEGLLTFDAMDQALSGLFTVSYKVGYWNPETKQWTTGWINLPVRWLPHERRLLEYRALIDRIMDLYREFYNYLKSAVRTMVVTPEEAKQLLVNFVKLLDAHYSKIALEITGYPTRLKHDAEYLDVWFEMFEQLGQFEAMERARWWWNRVSGWLLYRIAYGYVDVDKVVQMFQKLKSLLKLSDIEMNAYITIVDAIYNIVGKERIPTPWQMATLAEYMMVPDNLIVKSIDAYKVEEDYRRLLYQYVKLRPIKLDYRELIIDAIRALRARRITKEVLDQIIERARNFGFTEPEIQILKMRGEFLSMVYENIESKSVRVPTPWQLATLAEYMSIPQQLIAKSITEYGLDPDFADFVARYVVVKPLKSDFRRVITSALRALRHGVITREMFDGILKNASSYGFTEPELALIQMSAELDLAVDSAREYVPTPTMLATMAEVLPEVRDYIAQVFEARRVRGVWAELWAKYIYLRPVIDEARRWLNAVVALVERSILPMDALDDMFKLLSTYGYEPLEREIIMRTVLSNRARHVWGELLGTARNLVAMSRYSDVAADMAWSRVVKIVDALPVDNQTKDLIKTMWRQYIIHYQNYPEIRAYVTELVTSYANGVIDDVTFERELQYLKQLGVPEMTLALIRRRARLRRERIATTRRRRG